MTARIEMVRTFNDGRQYGVGLRMHAWWVFERTPPGAGWVSVLGPFTQQQGAERWCHEQPETPPFISGAISYHHDDGSYRRKYFPDGK